MTDTIRPEYRARVKDRDGDRWSIVGSLPFIEAHTNEARLDVLWIKPTGGTSRLRQPPAPVIFCVRDPDYDNEYTTIGNVEYVDIDTGRSDLSDEDTLADWIESHLTSVREYREQGRIDVAEEYEHIIEQQCAYDDDQKALYQRIWQEVYPSHV